MIFNELCKGVVKRESKEYIYDIISDMRRKMGIQGIVLGCTELEMLIKPCTTSMPTIFDTTEAHIESLVDFIIEGKQ